MTNPSDWLARVSLYHWVRVRSRTAQQRPLDTRVERDIGGWGECRGQSGILLQETPLPPPLTPSILHIPLIFLRFSSHPVFTLKFLLTAFNTPWSPKRTINRVLYWLRMCHIPIYITSSPVSSLSDLLNQKLTLYIMSQRNPAFTNCGES